MPASLTVVARVPEGDILHAGELEIRLADGLVLAGGGALVLSVREFGLLVAMARRPGRILSRGELFAAVWGDELQPGNRSVDVYVSKLRSKLETAMPDRRFIHTHPRFGYRFEPEPSREPFGWRAIRSADGHVGRSSLSRNVYITTPED